MTIAYYSTDVMLAALKAGKPATSFLTKRYFPETPKSEFLTGDVLIEYKNGNQKAAPFVVPHIGGVAIERKGYTSNRYEPANIEVKKNLKVEDLKKKGFGEAIYSQDTPEVREQKLLSEDLIELDELITRRQEIMASDVMTNNKIVMSYETGDKTKPETKEIRYYTESANPYTFAPEKDWTAADATIIEDIFDICQMMNKKGVRPEDLIITPSVIKSFRNNEKVMKLLDTRDYKFGNIDPKDLTDGAKLLGTINVDGYLLNLISYNEEYEDENGNSVPYIADGTIIVAAPGSGQTVYGAVSQKEESDKQTHTYAGRRVPKKTTNVDNDLSTIKLTSKPLLAPAKSGGWVSAKVVTNP